jgi:hypothetical protein
VCVVLTAGCRTSAEADGFHAAVQVGQMAPVTPEALARHRFGGWLVLEPDPRALELLAHCAQVERAGFVEDAVAQRGAALEDGLACASLFEARGALYVAAGFPRAAAGDFQRAVALASTPDAAPVPVALLAEATTLATEDATRVLAVEAQRERLEACRGEQLSDDGWLVRALLGEMPGVPALEVAATFQALDVPRAELLHLTASLLTACQLADPATADEARARLLAEEPDPARRVALERCLTKPGIRRASRARRARRSAE